MSDPAIIEAAVQALAVDDFEDVTTPAEEFRRVAHRVLAAVAPLIRAQVLEEAAHVVDDLGWDHHASPADYSAAIRALKEQP